MAEPIVDLQWGKTNWNDYEHNWREKDAEYLQARVIVRFQTTALRNTALGAGDVGMVVYNNELDRLEWRSNAGGWKQVNPLPQFLAVSPDTSAAVGLAHTGAAGKGITLTPADVKITHDLDVLSGVFKVATAGITLKTGPTTVVLTTDANGLASDKQIKAPKLDVSGVSGVGVDASGKEVVAATVTATTVAATNVNFPGGTLTGGVVNGTSGTIGGVALGVTANKVTAPAGFGFTAATTVLTGDANSAVLKAGAKLGKITMDDAVTLEGGGGANQGVQLKADMDVRNKLLKWYDSGNTFRGNFAVSVYSATDPGAANYPDGTIWFS